MTKQVTRNALMAATYAAIALVLPATAAANFRLSTALYVLAALNPSLVPGLALGNALAGLPQGPVDVVMGGLVGWLTAWACSKMGRLSPLAVLVIPTLAVPLWLHILYGAPYLVVVLVVAKGQALSAFLGWMILQANRVRTVLSGR